MYRTIQQPKVLVKKEKSSALGVKGDYKFRRPSLRNFDIT